MYGIGNRYEEIQQNKHCPWLRKEWRSPALPDPPDKRSQHPTKKEAFMTGLFETRPTVRGDCHFHWLDTFAILEKQ